MTEYCIKCGRLNSTCRCDQIYVDKDEKEKQVYSVKKDYENILYKNVYVYVIKFPTGKGIVTTKSNFTNVKTLAAILVKERKKSAKIYKNNNYICTVKYKGE